MRILEIILQLIISVFKLFSIIKSKSKGVPHQAGTTSELFNSVLHFKSNEYFKERWGGISKDTNTITNAEHLLRRIDVVRDAFGAPLIITSGYRSPDYNVSIGGSQRSAHCEGRAVDLNDPDANLARFLLSERGLSLLASLSLYMEHPNYTQGWIHLTSRAPASKRRVFIP